MCKLIRLFCLLLLAWLATPAFAVQTLPLYTYYDEAPFAINTPNNLTFKLADWLSRQSAGRYHFVPTFIPRRRLELVIMKQPGWEGVVAWVSPAFFVEDNPAPYLWSVPYMTDINLVISNRQHPVDFKNASSLHGLTIGAILGRYLSGFEDDIKAGKIKREDASTTLGNLQKLQRQRIDVSFITASALPYYRSQMDDMDSWLYIAATPRNIVQRQLLTGKHAVPLMQYLNQTLPKLAHSQEWKHIIAEMKKRPSP